MRCRARYVPYGTSEVRNERDYGGGYMKYSKDLFVENVQLLISYDYEPEISIYLKNGNHFFVVAYKNYVELTDAQNTLIRLDSIEEIFSYFPFEDIDTIEGDIDFEFPLSSQSVVVDGKLWFNAGKRKNLWFNAGKRK